MPDHWERLTIDASDPTPLHAQLERGVRVAISTGRLKPGDQLPTVRQLAVDLRINANTVAKVYAHLERNGALETRRGIGTFVSAGVTPAVHERARATALRALALRTLAEASAQGFTATELVEELVALTRSNDRGEEE